LRVTAAVVVGLCLAIRPASAQDLAPRAYLITPVGANAVTMAYSFNQGSVFVDPEVPIEDLKVQFQTQAISYYRAYSLLGRSANITFLLPYALADAQGTVQGSSNSLYRSGLADSRVRLAINVRGGPAQTPKDFLSWHEKGLIGLSFTAVVPTGQYDPARLINGGTNRWAFKPEVGFSRRWRRWVVEGNIGVWLFTRNISFFPGNSVRTQQPVIAGEGHLTFYAKPRLWTSFDANYWVGGRSTVDGQANADGQRNSRVGITAAIPINRNQAVKLSYAMGAYVRRGGDYNTISLAWQYSWLDKRE